jgi:hypothetical protein
VKDSIAGMPIATMFLLAKLFEKTIFSSKVEWINGNTTHTHTHPEYDYINVRIKELHL